jgi:hypothetical protein
MFSFWTVMYLIFVGIVAGFVARLLVPGRDALGFWRTIVLGIAGSFAGGFLAWAVIDRISLKRRVPRPIPMAPPGRFNDILAVLVGLALYGAFIGFVHLWLFGVSPMGMR